MKNLTGAQIQLMTDKTLADFGLPPRNRSDQSIHHNRGPIYHRGHRFEACPKSGNGLICEPQRKRA